MYFHYYDEQMAISRCVAYFPLDDSPLPFIWPNLSILLHKVCNVTCHTKRSFMICTNTASSISHHLHCDAFDDCYDHDLATPLVVSLVQHWILYACVIFLNCKNIWIYRNSWTPLVSLPRTRFKIPDSYPSIFSLLELFHEHLLTNAAQSRERRGYPCTPCRSSSLLRLTYTPSFTCHSYGDAR